jgi:hypothetical protein
VPDNIYSALVGSVQLNEVVPPGLPEDLLDDGDGSGCLANARRPREEQMRQVLGLDVGLKALDYIVLAHDIVQLLRPVLLNPDLLFDGRPLTLMLRAVNISNFLMLHSESILSGFFND